MVRRSGPVTLHIRNEKLGDVLKYILRPNNLTYTIIDNTIVLKEENLNDATTLDMVPDLPSVHPILHALYTPVPASLLQLNIGGTVRGETNNHVPAASVIVKGMPPGTFTVDEGK